MARGAVAPAMPRRGGELSAGALAFVMNVPALLKAVVVASAPGPLFSTRVWVVVSASISGEMADLSCSRASAVAARLTL